MLPFVRAIVRTILWPVREFFDPRFAGVVDRVDFHAEHTLEVVRSETHRISTEVGRARAEVARAQGVLEHIDAAIDAHVAHVHSALAGIDAQVRAEIDNQTEATALIGQSLSDINTSGQHIGEQLRALTLFETTANQIREQLESLAHELHEFHGLSDVRARASARAVEMPYVFRALASLEPGAKVLDIGAAESTISLSLASLGYRVTALDPQALPLAHPMLEVVSGSVEDFDGGDAFDAIVCVSTLKYIGVPTFGQDRLHEDAKALERMRLMMKKDGLLVLTVPYGARRIDELQRTYDRADLDRLLETWKTLDLTLVERQTETTWIRIAETEISEDGRERVAMITAERP
jgi:SAM-dependent methyltransferase